MIGQPWHGEKDGEYARHDVYVSHTAGVKETTVRNRKLGRI